ncbi:dihydrofolate reductase family protein [Humibacter soli]
MARLIISENITLDGVVDDPTGEDGTENGGWFDTFMRDDRGEWAAVEFAEAQQAEALLLGRRSDAYFGSRWNSATGEWADRLNGLPKYVVSSTLDEPVWRNATVLADDPAEEVAELKRHLTGDVVTYASRRLVQTLLEHDLVDEVRLIVFPVVLGSGLRLFEGGAGHAGRAAHALRLRTAEAVGDGLVRLVYDVDREG